MKIFSEEAKKRELEGKKETEEEKDERVKNEQIQADEYANKAEEKANLDFEDEESYQKLPEKMKASIDKYIEALVKERVDE